MGSERPASISSSALSRLFVTHALVSGPGSGGGGGGKKQLGTAKVKDEDGVGTADSSTVFVTLGRTFE